MAYTQLEYKEWVDNIGQYLRRWKKLDTEQRWFVFVNNKEQIGPRISKARNIKQVPLGMIWSRR